MTRRDYSSPSWRDEGVVSAFFFFLVMRLVLNNQFEVWRVDFGAEALDGQMILLLFYIKLHVQVFVINMKSPHFEHEISRFGCFAQA